MSSSVRTIRELTGFTGRAVLVAKGEDHFVVSSTSVPFSGYETLVFPADSEGSIVSWGEVAGGRGMSRGDAIEDLASRDIDVAALLAEREA